MSEREKEKKRERKREREREREGQGERERECGILGKRERNLVTRASKLVARSSQK